MLSALSDCKERHITAICLMAECSSQRMQEMAERGLVRFPDVLKGGRRIQITPKGLEMLTRFRKAGAEDRI